MGSDGDKKEIVSTSSPLGSNDPDDPMPGALHSTPPNIWSSDDTCDNAQLWVPNRLQLMIGGGIAAGLFVVVLIGVYLIFVGAYSWMNAPPSITTVERLVGKDKAIESYQQLHTASLPQTKDLLQLLVISLSVPLLTTVIGYIFGRQVKSSSRDSQGGKPLLIASDRTSCKLTDCER